MLGAVGFGSMSVAWHRARDTMNLAARGAGAAPAVSAAQGKNAAPAVVTAAAAGGALAAKKAFPAHELPYVPKGFGPEELATRTRVKFPDLGLPEGFAAAKAGTAIPGWDGEEEAPAYPMPGAKEDDAETPAYPMPGAKDDDAETPGYPMPGADDEEAEKLGYPMLGQKTDEAEKPGYPTLGESDEDEEKKGVSGVEAESPAETVEEGKCQTCAKRKYQDGSDDPGVSFKFAQHVDPKVAGARVRGHEMEHVVRERAKAQQEGRKVVSQSVTYHTGICPECGKFYVAGGTTRTVTAKDNTKDFVKEMAEKVKRNMGLDISA